MSAYRLVIAFVWATETSRPSTTAPATYPLAEYALYVTAYAGLEIVGDAFEQCAVIHRELENVRVGVCNNWAR